MKQIKYLKKKKNNQFTNNRKQRLQETNKDKQKENKN